MLPFNRCIPSDCLKRTTIDVVVMSGNLQAEIMRKMCSSSVIRAFGITLHRKLRHQ